jgi:hypothetical protein
MTAPVSPSAPVAWRWRNKPDGVWNYQEDCQRIPNVEQQPLYASPAPSMVGLREKVARIIDPESWAFADEVIKNVAHNSAGVAAYTKASLAKADQCLALLAREGV